jgi:hypothetical protein
MNPAPTLGVSIATQPLDLLKAAININKDLLNYLSLGLSKALIVLD